MGLQHTPPHSQLIHYTEIERQQGTKDVGATPTFTRKRLFDTASGSTERDAPSKKRTSSEDKESPLDTLRNRPQGPLPDDLPPYVDTAEKDLVNKGEKTGHHMKQIFCLSHEAHMFCLSREARMFCLSSTRPDQSISFALLNIM